LSNHLLPLFFTDSRTIRPTPLQLSAVARQTDSFGN